MREEGLPGATGALASGVSATLMPPTRPFGTEFRRPFLAGSGPCSGLDGSGRSRAGGDSAGEVVTSAWNAMRVGW